MMARLPQTKIDDTSIPYRVVIDFLEGTLRKQDAVAFARGFIEHHFDAKTNSGYYVAPYEGGYIFEAQEGGAQHAYLPGVLAILADNPSASACVQMARRVLEVKRSVSGVYTSILLPEGTEPQNPDKVFPEAGPKLIPFQRSGMRTLLAGFSIFGIGFLTLMLATIVYLVEVSGLLQPPLATIDYNTMPVRQWPSLEKAGGGQDPDKYVRTIHFDNGQWHSDIAPRKEMVPTDMPPAVLPGADNPNPLAPPGLPPLPVNGAAPSAARPLAGTPVPPPLATPPVATAPGTAH